MPLRELSLLESLDSELPGVVVLPEVTPLGALDVLDVVPLGVLDVLDVAPPGETVLLEVPPLSDVAAVDGDPDALVPLETDALAPLPLTEPVAPA
jgi:hypothetical protein